MKFKMKKWVVYLLMTIMVTPAYLIMSIAGAKPAMAAMLSKEFTSSDVNATDWEVRGDELYTWGSKPGDDLKADDVLDNSSDLAGYYKIEAQWLVWSNHTKHATYEISQGSDEKLISDVDQAKLADGSVADNGTKSGYRVLDANYFFEGDHDVDLKLLGENSDNGNNSFISFRVTLVKEEPLPVLSAEDFGVVDYNVGGGLGELKGYTAGFGLSDATFENAQSVEMKLYAGDTLLQTNTATVNVGTDVTGKQISSPFDVAGTFNYAADGYWVNHREAQYGQGLAATRVVATVTLASGTVVTAENTNLVGDATTLFPATPATPEVTVTAGAGKSIDIAFKGVDGGVAEYGIYVNNILAKTITVTGDDLGHDYLVNVPVEAFGSYSVYIIAKNATNGMSQSIARDVILTAPVAVVKASVVKTEVVTSVPSTSAVAAPAQAQEKLEEQGEIKGEETAEDSNDKINWTPWIILFILILLAGAATGGYFYWFGGDSSTSAATVSIKEKKAVVVPPAKKSLAKKPAPKGDKKSRRW